MLQSKVVSVSQNKTNPRFPDSVSYSVTVEDETKTVFSPNYCPEVGTMISYETTISSNSGAEYLRIVEQEQTAITGSTTAGVYKPTAQRTGTWQQRKMLPPLSPQEVANTYQNIYTTYSEQGFFDGGEGFTAEDHRHILISMFIAATKPREFYEELEQKENVDTAFTTEDS
jgi:hypothetical protein